MLKIIVGIALAIIGAYSNPMMWFDNYKGEPTLYIYITAFVMIGGLLLWGYGMAEINKREV